MVKAYVLIVNESGTEDSVISNLKNIPCITDAFGTFGTWDILTKLVSSNEENIQHDISNKIRNLPLNLLSKIFMLTFPPIRYEIGNTQKVIHNIIHLATSSDQ